MQCCRTGCSQIALALVIQYLSESAASVCLDVWHCYHLASADQNTTKQLIIYIPNTSETLQMKIRNKHCATLATLQGRVYENSLTCLYSGHCLWFIVLFV